MNYYGHQILQEERIRELEQYAKRHNMRQSHRWVNQVVNVFKSMIGQVFARFGTSMKELSEFYHDTINAKQRQKRDHHA